MKKAQRENRPVVETACGRAWVKRAMDAAAGRLHKASFDHSMPNLITHGLTFVVTYCLMPDATGEKLVAVPASLHASRADKAAQFTKRSPLQYVNSGIPSAVDADARAEASRAVGDYLDARSDIRQVGEDLHVYDSVDESCTPRVQDREPGVPDLLKMARALGLNIPEGEN